MTVTKPRFWRTLQREHPVALIVLVTVLAGTLAADGFLMAKQLDYKRESSRLREGMTAAQQERADLILEAERHRFRVQLELIRRQARSDHELHLAINVDSGRMVLEREGVTLREMRAEVGPELIAAGAGDSTVQVQTLGERTVERVLTGDWDLSDDFFRRQGVPAGEEGQVRASLGTLAVLLNSGTLVYAVTDSTQPIPVLHGSVRIAPADLRAIAESVTPGMSVYFYR
jgi:hypothetical protein